MAENTDTPAPTLGAYTNPSAPIIDKREKVETPASNIQEGIRTELKNDVESAQGDLDKSKTYVEILADNDIEPQRAQAIVDAMLTDGFYEETVAVTKSVSLTLRTRSYTDYKRYLRVLELHAPRYIEEQQELMVRYFLAASLATFKGHSFTHAAQGASSEEIEAAFDTRMEWVLGQGERVISLLASKLTTFDKAVQVVMSEGVVENF